MLNVIFWLTFISIIYDKHRSFLKWPQEFFHEFVPFLGDQPQETFGRKTDMKPSDGFDKI
jgi:hypothetical protein